MRITAELSLYPLQDDFTGPIKAFIHELRRQPGIEVVTNQLSTQLRGEFDAVTAAVTACLKAAMLAEQPVILVAKYVSADLPIATPPSV
jgi:uncharacterized protein YqgV (UPF0045/DUF77 family)